MLNNGGCSASEQSAVAIQWASGEARKFFQRDSGHSPDEIIDFSQYYTHNSDMFSIEF